MARYNETADKYQKENWLINFWKILVNIMNTKCKMKKKNKKKISLPNIPTYIMNSPNQLDAPVEI